MYRVQEEEKMLFSEKEMQAFEKEVRTDRNKAIDNLNFQVEYYTKKENIKKAKALKKYKDSILETEKLLRFEAHKDRCLWLMIKSMANNKEFKDRGGVQIKDIEKFSLATLDTFLEEYVEMEVAIPKTTDKKVAQIFERDELGSLKTVAIPIDVRNRKTGLLETQIRQIPIVEGEYENAKKAEREVKKEEYKALTIKDYGDLRRFAKDRRLPELLAYFSKTYFSKNQLEIALNYLDNQRATVLQKALDLEEKIETHATLKTEYYSVLPSIKAELQAEEHLENLKKDDKAKPKPFESDFAHKYYIYFLGTKGLLDNYFEGYDFSAYTPQGRLYFIASSIYSLRNKIIHNEVPYNDYLKNQLVLKSPETPLQVTEFIIAHTIRIYEQLAAAVQKTIGSGATAHCQ